MDELYILGCLFFASLVAATFGFGDALISIPLIGLVIDFRIAIVLMGFWGIILSPMNIYKYREFLDKPTLKIQVAIAAPSAILGALLVILAPLSLIKLMLGFFVCFFVIKKSLSLNNRKIEEKSHPLENLNTLHPLVLYGGSFSYGFFGALVGASGPINVMVLEARGLYKESFIGTFAVTSLAVAITKICTYLYTGLFPTELIGVYLLGIPIIILAAKLGHLITPKIPLKEFQYATLLIMMIMGVRLFISGILLFF